MPDLTQVNTYATATGTNSTNAFVTHFDTRSPTPQDVNWPLQKRWVNLATHAEYILANFISSSSAITANWIQLGGGLATTETLTGNSGGAVPPTGNNINVLGDTTTINIVGTPSTSTLTANVILPATPHVTLIGETSSIAGVGPGTSLYVLTSNGSSSDPSYQPVSASGAVISLEGDTGDATPSMGEIKISGGTTGITTTASGSTVDLNIDFTAYSVICGGTVATGPLQNVVGVGSANQVLTSNGAAALPTWQNVVLPVTNPFFEAYSSAGATSVTGDGTAVTIVYDTVVVDNDGNFNTSTYTFTAPVNGNYQFNVCVAGRAVGDSTSFYIQLMVSGLSLGFQNFGAVAPNVINNDQSFYFSTAHHMSAGDTAYVVYTLSGGTKSAGYFGGVGETMFSGYLVCL